MPPSGFEHKSSTSLVIAVQRLRPLGYIYRYLIQYLLEINCKSMQESITKCTLFVFNLNLTLNQVSITIAERSKTLDCGYSRIDAFGFETRRGHGNFVVVLKVLCFVRQRSLRRADNLFVVVFFLFTQNFIRHFKLKQDYSLLPLSAQYPFFNTATRLTCYTVQTVITNRIQGTPSGRRKKKGT